LPSSPNPFSLFGRRGTGFKVPLPSGEGFRVREAPGFKLGEV